MLHNCTLASSIVFLLTATTPQSISSALLRPSVQDSAFEITVSNVWKYLRKHSVSWNVQLCHLLYLKFQIHFLLILSQGVLDSNSIDILLEWWDLFSHCPLSLQFPLFELISPLVYYLSCFLESLPPRCLPDLSSRTDQGFSSFSSTTVA